MDLRQELHRLPETAGSALGGVLAGMFRLRYGNVSRTEWMHRMVSAAIEPPSTDLLERAMSKRWDNVYHGKSGELMVTMDPDLPGEIALRVTASLEGDRSEYIAVRVFGDRVWDSSMREALREACDDWSHNYRFPRLYTHRTRRGAVAVVCEGQLYVGDSGVHQALVEDFVNATAGGAARFWNRLLSSPPPLGRGSAETAGAARPARSPGPAPLDSLPPLTDDDLRRLLESGQGDQDD